jgi:hypothetical protein
MGGCGWVESGCVDGRRVQPLARFSDWAVTYRRASSRRVVHHSRRVRRARSASWCLCTEAVARWLGVLHCDADRGFGGLGFWVWGSGRVCSMAAGSSTDSTRSLSLLLARACHCHYHHYQWVLPASGPFHGPSSTSSLVPSYLSNCSLLNTTPAPACCWVSD